MLRQISGLLNTALLGVVITLQLTIIALDQGVSDGFETLDHVGSFLGGIAGLTAAGIAVFGFDIWKRQITHGKYLTLIWEAMVATQKLDTHMALLSLNLLFRHQNANLYFDDAVKADRLIAEKLFATLRESCSAIDVIAARKGVELSNICGFWEGRLKSVNRFADSSAGAIEPEPLVEWTAKLSSLMEPAQAEGTLLKNKLSALEQRFS
jgi:hypothetical protein